VVTSYQHNRTIWKETAYTRVLVSYTGNHQVGTVASGTAEMRLVVGRDTAYAELVV
jgi:hypothetical protein